MFETDRLLVRKLTLKDLDWIVEMRMEPEVNRYLGGTRLQNPEAIAARLQFYLDCYDTFGFGQCGMIWKETGEMIGCSGLQPLENTGEIEVGYSLKKDYWRRGIGFECAFAWLTYGFGIAGLERIVAVTDPRNTGSWRIMEKCGMKYQGMIRAYGFECMQYSISKQEFAGGSK